METERVGEKERERKRVTEFISFMTKVREREREGDSVDFIHD